MIEEGVTRFSADHAQAPLPDVRNVWRALNAWRDVLRMLGLIGADPERYGGIGFGNLSARAELDGPAFIITGTQTGARVECTENDYCRVEQAWTLENRVRSVGPTRPSSESMTHAAVYAANAQVHAVFHTHAPEIWAAAQALGLATTTPDVDYGTPEMARQVEAHVATSRVGALAMLGHEDGVVVWAPTADEAGALTVTLAARARAL